MGYAWLVDGVVVMYDADLYECIQARNEWKPAGGRLIVTCIDL